MPMGIEMEFNSLDEYKARRLDIPNNWQAKGDGSLANGTEFVSPIIQWEHTATEQAVAILNLAKENKAKVGGYSSVHIHCSHPSGINHGGWAVWFARNIVVHDAALGEAFTSENRRSKYAKRFDDNVKRVADMDPRVATMEDVRKQFSSGTRFRGANFQALFAHGTIELRYFNGTRCAKKLAQYIEVARVLNHHATVGSVADADEFLIRGYNKTPSHPWIGKYINPNRNQYENYEPATHRTSWFDNAEISDTFRKTLFFQTAKAISESDWNGNMWELDLQPAALRLQLRKFSLTLRKLIEARRIHSMFRYRDFAGAAHRASEKRVNMLNGLVGYNADNQDPGFELTEVIRFLQNRSGIMPKSDEVYFCTSRKQRVSFAFTPKRPAALRKQLETSESDWVFDLYMVANPNG